MELSMEVVAVLQEAIRYARSERMEYVTPETVLFVLLGGSSAQRKEADGEKALVHFDLAERFFLEAFNNCGGDGRLLRKELGAYLSDNIERIKEKEDRETECSSLFNEMLSVAARSAYSSGSTEVYVRHLIRGLWSLDDCYAVYFLEKQGITEADMLQEMGMSEGTAAGAVNSDDGEEDSREDAAGIAMYAPCLNETLKDANPLIGREAELERTIQILCRKEKNNPLHIGEPGVGKTALTYGLVQLIKEGRVPDAIKGAKVFSLDLGSLLSGTQYRGDFEKRFKKVLSAISKEDKPIIYIDEIHSLSGAGAVGESSFDASNMLKTYLSEGHLRFIGATTFEEYKKYFEKNKSLTRRFQNVEIKEPSEDETVEILRGLKEKYEDFHGVSYEEGVLEYAVRMSSKYIHERFLPDKAIDLIDEAGSYRKLHPSDGEGKTVDRAVINEILTKICRVPIETVETEDAEKLKTLEERLKQKVYGQDEAIKEVVNAVKFSKAGLLEENKPLASLLFAGPTGVGKTESSP